MSLRYSNIPSRYDYATMLWPSSQSMSVNDYMPYTDLSIKRALAKIPKQDRESYANLYRWFESETGKTGSRYHGQLLPGVEFKHAAQRGIHAPSGRRYAATVTVKQSSLYSSDGDGRQCDLGDGTWVLFYSAHRNNSGNRTDAIWNQKLLNCLVDGVPVGVFLQTGKSSSSYLRALAFVEEYNPENDLFTLHGPVTPETEPLFSSVILLEGSKETDAGDDAEAVDADEGAMLEDRREIITARRVIRKGQRAFRDALVKAYEGRCAVTGVATNEVLQAAHILDYRGTQSNVASNGVLLRADVHLLFDNYLIGINPSSYRIEVNAGVPDGVYTALDGKQLLLPSDSALRPNEKYLIVKYERFKCA